MLNPTETAQKKECCICNEDGLTLKEIAKLPYKAFGKIPLKDIVKQLYALGYKETDRFCEECILK